MNLRQGVTSIAALLCGLCTGALPLLSGQEAEELVIHAGAIVDPASRSIRNNVSISVKGELITAISDRREARSSSKEVDASNLFILPGLIDAHTHLCIRIRPDRDQGEYLVLKLFDPDPYRALQGASHAGEMLRAGFTTVRDLGNSGNYVDLDLKRGIRAGLVEGPSIVAAGRIISAFGGQHYLRDLRDGRALTDDTEYLIADTRDEIVKAVRENIWHGVDVIKVIADGQPYAYSAEELELIVAEAARAGKKVAAHAQTAAGARAAAAAGVASIEHGWVLPPEVLDTMRNKKIALVSTDFTAEALEGFGWGREPAASIHKRRVDRLKTAAAAGVTLAFGSDLMVTVSGKTRGRAAAEYVHSYLEASVEPWTILQAFTSNSATLLGLDDRGAIRVGARADLVAVPRNPVLDPAALKDTSLVVKGGRVVTPVR